MASQTMEGNTEHGQATEEQRAAERPRWAFYREPRSPEEEKRVSLEVVSSGSMIEAVGGFAAVVLSILALATVAPAYLPPIAVIALGIALLFEGGRVCACAGRLPSNCHVDDWFTASNVRETLLASIRRQRVSSIVREASSGPAAAEP